MKNLNSTLIISLGLYLQCSHKRQYKDLKLTELGLDPIQTRLGAFLGFLVKTKTKAYTKLTVVMFCQIVARKSAAPSSSDFRRRHAPVDEIRNFEDFFFSKIIITPLLRLRPDLCKCVTSMPFQEILVFLLGGHGGGVPNWKYHSDFFVFKKKNL